MSLQRSGSLSSNCSHAVQCSSDVESNVRRRPCIKHTTPNNNNNTALVTNNTPKPGFPQSGSGRYKKSGLSQSYDDLLSAASNSSANSTYGFVRPVLKRLECANFFLKNILEMSPKKSNQPKRIFYFENLWFPRT